MIYTYSAVAGVARIPVIATFLSGTTMCALASSEGLATPDAQDLPMRRIQAREQIEELSEPNFTSVIRSATRQRLPVVIRTL